MADLLKCNPRMALSQLAIKKPKESPMTDEKPDALTQTIEIESIARLDVKPGETLVANLGDYRADSERVSEIAEVIRQKMPDGVEVLITSGDVELKVIAKERE